MSHFSIDESIEQIKNPYTKTLFKEVYSSYAMGNYRSTVVMLWSVVVTDLVLKLKELESVYGDATATRILNEIKTEQSKDATSSKWEIKIVEKFFNELGFFETYEVSQMENLQKMRHASAHPVITNADMLYTPPKSLVYSLIQIALEGVLIKEALFSSKVIDFILNDLESIQKTLTTFDDKEKFFTHKFLNKMSNPILLKLIKRLWTFVFLKNDSKMELNRDINFDALEIILKNRKDIFIEFMKSEKKFISSLNMDNDLLKKLFEFLYNHRYLLDFFEKECVDTIHSVLDKSVFKKFEMIKFSKIIDYLDYLKGKEYKRIPIFSVKKIYDECSDVGAIKNFYELCVNGYANSSNYENADTKFNSLISPYLNEFDLDDVSSLIEKCNEKSQVCDRWRSKKDHRLVIDRMKELDSSFDFSPFRNFIYGNEKYIPSLESVEDEDDD